MCRMVGWVSSTPRMLAELLGDPGLAELTALSQQHADGWGMAWREGATLRRERSQLPAHACPDFDRVTTEVRSDAAVLHLRWATPGMAVSPENTHPFLWQDVAFAHNGAVRPAAGLLALMKDGAEVLRGDSDSERLMHVLLDRVTAQGLEPGLRSTVADVCRALTPTSLNALVLGPDSLTALCSYAAVDDPQPPLHGDGERRPGHFDLWWRQTDDAVVVASEPLGDLVWDRLDNGTALIATAGESAPRQVQVGSFPPATVARERRRNQQASVDAR